MVLQEDSEVLRQGDSNTFNIREETRTKKKSSNKGAYRDQFSQVPIKYQIDIEKLNLIKEKFLYQPPIYLVESEEKLN